MPAANDSLTTDFPRQPFLSDPDAMMEPALGSNDQLEHH